MDEAGLRGHSVVNLSCTHIALIQLFCYVLGEKVI